MDSSDRVLIETGAPSAPSASVEPARPGSGESAPLVGGVGGEIPSSKGGAPKHNTNAVTHGLTGSGWPEGCDNDRRAVAKFQATLRQMVAAANGGEIGLVHAAQIQTAVRLEKHARLAARWLRREADEMSAADRLHYSREVAKASIDRDKTLQALFPPNATGPSDWGRRVARLRASTIDSNGGVQ